MPKDPFIREKFTRERSAAKKLAAEFFQRFPKERYQTEVESWRHLQSQNYEFTMKRLRDPIEAANAGQRHFDEPIPLPRVASSSTLKDAGTSITKLPKAEHEAAEWQAAMEALILVARGGPTMLARIGVMRALNRHVERVFNPNRKRPALGAPEAGKGSMRESPKCGEQPKFVTSMLDSYALSGDLFQAV
jgi:hypothetical protein